MFSRDIIEYTCEILCVYHYNKCNIFNLINKTFSTFINEKLYKLNNSDTNIFMATHIKYWRPELDQTAYIYDEFMIFDNSLYINNWINDDSIKFESILFGIQKEIIELNLFNYYKRMDTFSYINKNLDDLEKYKLIFEDYFIYYFYEDLIMCYDIKFTILPYFDERLTKKESFLHYQKIKKNRFYNHNITSVNSIEF